MSQRKSLLNSLTDEEAEVLLYEWKRWARPNQLAPEGDWTGWLLLAGRGYGKTRTALEWLRGEVEEGRATRIALVSETAADGRDVLVEGESGILAISPPWLKPTYESSKRRVTWPNGAIATLYDAREPDQLRGPQHDCAVLDELAKYRYAQAVWDNLLPGLRLGKHPRWVAATTPRPIPLIKSLIRDPHVVTTKGKSTENLANLASTFKQSVIDRYAGTRLGRQELDAEVLEDMPGALWTRRCLDEYRVDKMPTFKRIVVGVDPAATGNEGSNETGIVVCGLDEKNHGYVIEDWTVRGHPDVWARRAIAAYRKHDADRIVVETNQGGDMCAHTLKTIDQTVSIATVHASRGKYVRAEPIAALYEQGRIHHVGAFADLEDQMVAFTPESAADRSQGLSPDRVDALVWAFTNLFPSMTEKVIKVQKQAPPVQRSSHGWLGR